MPQSNVRKKPELTSYFNTLNILSLGGLLLSLSEFSWPGIGFFGVTFLFSLFNTGHERKIEKQGEKPSYKGREYVGGALMLAAGLNFLWEGFASGMAFLDGGFSMALWGGLAVTAAWAFGFMGDNAVRRNAKYKDVKGDADGKPLGTWDVVFANPSFFFNGTAAAFALNSMLLNPVGSLGFLAGAGIFTALAGSMLYAVNRGFKAKNGEIEAEEINDGVLNALAAAGNLVLAGFAFFTALTVSGAEMQYVFAAAQLVFAASALTNLFDTQKRVKTSSPASEQKPAGGENETAGPPPVTPAEDGPALDKS